MSSIASYMQANTVHEPDPRFENIPEIAMTSGNDYTTNNSQYNNNTNASTNQTGGGKKFRLKISQRLHHTAVLAFISYLIMLTSFASPYWLSSYKFTDSAFIRLGLWDFCFDGYRHPSYQYDIKFTGCHWIYSPVFTNIRDWLQPPWFMFVQAVMTIALCFGTLGLLIISIVFMHFLIQYQLIILCLTLVCHMFTTMLLGFAIIAFYLKAFDRSWISYPEHNHVDWAFFFALVSMAGNGYASYLYYQEFKDLKERMFKMKRLIVATITASASNGRQSMTGGGGGGDMDSLDAVYASRSVTSYNQSMGQNDNQIGGGGNRMQQQQQQQSATGAKQQQADSMYPHFTQV